jgi:hypothetical protein
LGFVAGSREAGLSERQAAAATYQDSRAVKDAARVELAALATVKQPTRAQAERRRELARILAPAPVETVQAAPAAVDPQSQALAGYLQALGYAATIESVSLWLNAFMVSFYEIAAAFAFVVAAGLKPTCRQQPASTPPAAVLPAGILSSPKTQTAASDEIRRPTDDDRDEPPPSKPKGGRPAAILPPEAVARLRTKPVSVRGAAKLLGVSKSTAHRLLHRLATEGRLSMAAAPHGISIALA